MPKIVTILGGFSKDELPVSGTVRFTPLRMWVVEDKTFWACLAPEVELNEQGEFVAEVTATDTDAIWWGYRVETPAGEFEIQVRGHEDHYHLGDLINEHRSGSRPTHG